MDGEHDRGSYSQFSCIASMFALILRKCLRFGSLDAIFGDQPNCLSKCT
jgi:hypothetical protein